MLRTPGANLRTQFLRIAKRAGVSPWAKPFQNMRSTRETELIERLDLKPACAIIGNSEVVALQHYQQLRPLYLESAIERDRAAKKEAQNAAHKLTELVGNARKATEVEDQPPNVTPLKIGQLPLDSVRGSLVPANLMGATGFEASPNSSGKRIKCDGGGAKCGAVAKIPPRPSQSDRAMAAPS